MRKLVNLILILVLLSSCEKQNPSGNADPENVGIPLIESEMYGEDLGWKYTYNEANLPEIIKTKWSYTRYFYNKNNEMTGYDRYEDPGIYSSHWETAQASMNRTEWVSPLNTERSVHAVMEYNNGVLKKWTVNNLKFKTSVSRVFEFGEDGQMIRETFESGYVEYIYNDDGNLFQRKQYHDGKLSAMHEYEYDTYLNPFIVFKKLAQPGKFTNKNNIIKDSTTLYAGDGSIEDVFIEESSFEYNDKGYPVKKDDMVTYIYQ